MSLKAFFASLAVVAGLTVAGSAQAAVQVVSVSGAVASATFDNAFNVGDGGIITGLRVGPGAFTHDVYFDVATGTGGGVTGTPNTLQIGSTTIFDVTGLTYQVFDAVTNLAITGVQSASSLLTFAAGPGGSYFVQFAGVASGLMGGNYTANIAITPIPAAVLLMAPALAGLGFAGYRRRKTA